MTWALLGGLLLVTAAFVTQTFLGRKDARELLAARDMLDQEREETRVVRGQLALEEAAHGVTQAQLKTEQDLRSVAEARLNLAQRRVTELLKSHLERASDEEIRAATAAAFADFDGGVPLSETDPYKADGLLDPGFDVPDA